MKLKKLGLILFFQIGFLSLLSQNSEKFSVKNLNTNTIYPDKCVSIFDNNFIIYSSQKSDNLMQKHTRVVKRRGKLKSLDLDYYFCAIDNNGEFLNKQRLSDLINSKYNDLGLCFNKERSVVYFAREEIIKNSDQKHFELFRAEVISPGSWARVKKLPFNKDNLSLQYPSLSDDGKILYFVSDKRGNLDIYKVNLLSDWGFSKPEKLSANINTSSDETSPFVFENKLFFSSNKPGGLGGYDVYYVDLENEKFIAQRLESPVNSDADDFCFVYRSSEDGFFTSNRNGGKGAEDIYSFRVNKKLKTKNFNEENLINKVVSNKEEDTTSVFNVKAQLKDNIIDKVDVTSGKTYDYQRRFVSIREDNNPPNYKSKDEYSDCQSAFDKLDNIYFDYSSAEIREDAAIELNKVIRVMRLCPKIRVIAASHTDCRAKHSYNLELSQLRSLNVVNYIIKNGDFSPERIIGVGYGETRIINGCVDGVKCSEMEHQLNRRTHFEIFNY